MLRFGFSARPVPDASGWAAVARLADGWGFDRFVVADHIGLFDPFPALVAAAHASGRLQVGTYVLNAGFWNPLLLARAAATTELLTGGRLVLGLGAGHAQTEFDQAGLPYPSAADRVGRLERMLLVLRRLLAGETVDDEWFGLRGATTGLESDARTPIPMLVGGNGDRVLRLAGRHADAVGLVGFRSGTGQTHGDLSHWSWAGLADRLAVVRAAATVAGRPPPDVDLLIQAVRITDDREATAAGFADDPAAPYDHHLDSPFLLLGTEDEVVAQCRRLHGVGVAGITVFAPDAPALAPVIAAIRATAS